MSNAFILVIGCISHPPVLCFICLRIVIEGSRDYSQAVDVGTLGRGIKLGTIRILVWVMGFMAHGYATEEFEVTTPLPRLHKTAISMMLEKLI